MQGLFDVADYQFQTPKPKPSRNQVGLLQPKGASQDDKKAKPVFHKAGKRLKKRASNVEEANLQTDEAYNRRPFVAPAGRPTSRSVADLNATEGDSRSLFRALKRKYETVEQESFKLVEELQRVDAEVKQLEEEKFSLLDELLVLEGLIPPGS